MPALLTRVTLVTAACALAAFGCRKNQAPAQDGPAKTVESGAAAEEEGNPDWIPNEHRGLKGKFKDTGVYVDGEPVGFLQFGQLPRSLEAVWLAHEEEGDFRYGEEPEVKTTYDRRYRLVEYLEAVGVDLDAIREVHVYGGATAAGRVTPEDLIRVRDRFYFSFGRDTSGKTRFHPPPDLDVGTSFDQLVAVAVYIEKEPPTIRAVTGEVEFEGGVYTDIPYFGEPLRGGIRVYRDDLLEAVIKRRLLEGEGDLGYWEGDQLRWRMTPFLASYGVNLEGVVMAELIHDDRRLERRMPIDELRDTYFVAVPMRSGEISVGDRGERMQAIALYTYELPPIDPKDDRYEGVPKLEGPP